MAEFNILSSVKIALGQQYNEYINDTFDFYINEVKQYLLAAGCDATLIESESSAGLIARGVADLWNYGSGSAELSPYFKERAIQLSLKELGSNGL